MKAILVASAVTFWILIPAGLVLLGFSRQGTQRLIWLSVAVIEFVVTFIVIPVCVAMNGPY
jgi:hypothetical protein